MNIREFREMLEHPEKFPVTQYPELPLPEAGTWAQVEMPGAEDKDFFIYFPNTPCKPVSVDYDERTGRYRWLFSDYTEFLLLERTAEGRLLPWETYSNPERVKLVWKNPFGGFSCWLSTFTGTFRENPLWKEGSTPRHVKLSDLRRIFDGPVIVDQD